jgi:hypothetical protein
VTKFELIAELEVAKAETHQIMKALEPWIGGNPDRSHLDLAHFSACAFRAWGATIKVIEELERAYPRKEKTPLGQMSEKPTSEK